MVVNFAQGVIMFQPLEETKKLFVDISKSKKRGQIFF